MLIALVVGHKSQSTGAGNKTHNITEWEYNARLALDVWRLMTYGPASFEACVVHRRTYSKLPGDINRVVPQLVVSMHCNAFNTKVSGTETLYYHRSVQGEEVAKAMQKVFVSELRLPDRGLLRIDREDRGGMVLAETNAPAVLCEPFFIDNDNDLERANSIEMANLYYRAILEGAKCL